MDGGLQAQYFKCEECSFESRYLKVIKRHTMSVHNNQQDFKCTECKCVVEIKSRLPNISILSSIMRLKGSTINFVPNLIQFWVNDEVQLML